MKMIEASQLVKISPGAKVNVKEFILNKHGANHHRFERSYIINNVSFDIMKGDAVAIIGHNGAGKSTLMSLIAGTISPTSGTVRINGKIRLMLDLYAGFHPELTGLENIAFYNSICDGENYSNERLARIKDFSELGEALDRPLRTFSSGMIARLAFAINITSDYDVLLIDEVLSVGDYNFRRKCLEEITRLKKNW